MRRLTAFLVAVAVVFPAVPVSAAPTPIARRDGFLLIWKSIARPADTTKEKPFGDVPKGAPGSLEITFAKARGLLDDDDADFHPDAPLKRDDALLWMFRTRSLEPLKDNGDSVFLEIPAAKDVALLAAKYNFSPDPAATVTQDELIAMMTSLDGQLAKEVHEVSLYSEKFNGKGTAFGETFDMNTLTAAHRSFPANTLVKVTNLDNGKSVIVRVNDRGPFVQGRNMDLSLAAFTAIADRAKGKINATLERLGDATLVNRCGEEVFQRRIGREVVLDPGIPQTLRLGYAIALSSKNFFFVQAVVYPDGTRNDFGIWIGPQGEVFRFQPSVSGTYAFHFRTKTGRGRVMEMKVVECGS